MSNYDFKTLSPVDFEILSRDLLQEEYEITLQSFTSGRDGGIDFRYSSDTSGAVVVQCKHYAESGYDTLLHNLTNKEFPKILMLKPSRYILTTSVPLTPKRKDEIVAALAPHILSADDVYGKDDLNNLLGKFDTIERKTIKLWLFSLPLLEEVLHSGVRNISRAELQRIRENAKLYVQNESFDQAVEILDTNNFCIIAGMPGIGKTILAEMLALHYSRVGFEVIKVTHDIAEAWELKGVEAKRLFYYDDFLGQSSLSEKLRKNEDQRLLDFIHAVRDTPFTKLIMTTREYIFQQALQEYEKLNREKFKQRCIVDLSKYTRFNRASILYNHIYFSALPSHFRAALQGGRAYLKIVDHPNYSPRIVQLLTEYARLRHVAVDDYAQFFFKSLDNPLAIWEQAFTNHLSQAARNLLVVFATLSYECFLNDIEVAFQAYNLAYSKMFGAAISPQDFRAALKELDGDFLKYDAQKLGIVVRFTNPSAADFVRQYIATSTIELELLLQSLVFFEQVNVIWSWSATRCFVIRCLVSDADRYAEIGLRLLSASACRIITYRRGNSERKEHWPYPIEQRLALFVKMAPLTSPKLLEIVRQNTPEIKSRIVSDDFDRRGLADLVDALEDIDDEPQRAWIDPSVVAYVDALINKPRWVDDLRPLCNLIQEHSRLFNENTLAKVAQAIESVAEHACTDSYELDSKGLREEVEALKSFSEIVSANVDNAISTLLARAEELDEQSSDDDDRIEYSSSSSSDDSHANDDDIGSMFSTLW
jgi:hypothetical protein